MSEISQIVKFLKKNFLNNVNYKKKSSRQSIHLSKNLNFLLKNDYLVERQLIPVKFLINIRKKFLNNLTPRNIFFPKDTSNLNSKQFKDLYKKNRTLKFWKNFPKISSSDHKQGIKSWKKKCNYVVFKNPEKICPEIKKIKDIPRIKKITDFYFDKLKYKHVHSKVIYTFKKKKFPIDVQVFHNDLDGQKVLKLFLYLNNVKNKSDGPTEFIKRSNIFFNENSPKLKNWKTRLIHKKQDMKFKYNSIFSFIGNVGDGFFLNTGVYHKGSMPKNKDRTLLILTFNCHDELITGKLN
tara:strand:- start:4613 stop:5497 length:885 start_codon:yes stop_codon:yes gene_type:complete